MGGYAPVIRADRPAPPAGAGRTGRAARPGGSDGPPDDMYVYRDPSARAGYLADRRAQEREAAYWYDDLSADPGAAEREDIRGPFEPLLPSSGTPPRARHEPSAPEAMLATPAALADYAQQPDAAGDEGPEEPAYAQARKLEQIKDLYLTAEAIGEENVDKHFDQLLAQQRELISEYFRQSAAARHADGLPAQAAANPIEPRQPGGRDGQFGAPEGAGVAAEPPRSW
jgi:hypothetical protein